MGKALFVRIALAIASYPYSLLIINVIIYYQMCTEYTNKKNGHLIHEEMTTNQVLGEKFP